MTSQPVRSCPSCGAGLSADAAFCPSCGTPAPPTGPPDHAAFRRPGAEPTSAPPRPAPSSSARSPLPPPTPPDADVVEAGPTRPPRSWSRRRRTIGVLVALVVLAGLAVGGGVLANRWGSVDSEVYGYGDEGVLPAAVTERPGLDWEWTTPGALSGLAATGDRTYVATERGIVTALDSGGDEVWSSDVGATGVLIAAHDHDELVLFEDIDHDSTTALSTDDGEALWSVDGDLQWYEDDRLFVTTDDELTAYDLGSGERIWAAKADHSVVGEAGIFVTVDGELRRVSATDGHTVWSVDAGPSDGDGPRVAVADDFVVVSGAGITAYGADRGDRLWSDGDLADGALVMLFSRDEVAVAPPAFGDDDLEVALYDRNGSSGSITTDSFFYAIPLRSGSEEYTFTLGAGDLYGSGHQVVATYDGGSALAAEGIYTLDDDRIGYYAYGESDPAWTLDDDFSGETTLMTGAHHLFVVQGHRVRSYS